MRVITWNMQGATGHGENKWHADVQRLIKGAEGDVLCLQECGAKPSTATRVAAPPAWLAGFGPPAGLTFEFLKWNLGSESRPYNVYILWAHTDLGANRNNLAVVTRTIPNRLIYVAPGLAGGRPSLGVRLQVNVARYLDFFTLHAFSRGGGDAPKLLANIATTGGLWFAAGDYNRDPATWGPPPLSPPPPNALLCDHNPVPTHPGSGTNLDYAFKVPGPAVRGVVMDQFVVSDHYPVVYDL